MEEVLLELWKAAESHKVCRISLKGEAFPRVIHPYGVVKTSGNKIVLVCWQEAGFTKAGSGAGYRNLMLEKVIEVEALGKRFTRSPDFNPSDGQYDEWVFHI